MPRVEIEMGNRATKAVRLNRHAPEYASTVR
jgi:hypothetical protein